MVDCSTVMGADTFTTDLHHAGTAGMINFKMTSATPAPPARDDNTWIIELDSMASGVVGNPIAGATMTATPFMPSHQHGTPKQVVITPMSTAGQYQLAPVNMWMPGVWETTIKVTSPQTDSAVFRFCIPS
ncbi:MAG: FixH family protein [Deltaproteobacteria bacterium]|nr:FixH family protein [Deltaproteobacteria bacterium]